MNTYKKVTRLTIILLSWTYSCIAAPFAATPLFDLLVNPAGGAGALASEGIDATLLLGVILAGALLSLFLMLFLVVRLSFTIRSSLFMGITILTAAFTLVYAMGEQWLGVACSAVILVILIALQIRRFGRRRLDASL